MKIKETLKIIVDKGKSEDMHKLNDMLDELICDLKEEKPSLYKEYKKKLYEIAYGKVITDSKATDLVSHMKPFGEYFTIDNAKEIRDKYSIRYSTSDIYLVLNSLYNDFHEILLDNHDMYAKMTKLWLNDADSVDNKVYEYFCNIPKEY